MVTKFQVHNPAYAQAVRDSFVKQGLLRHLGARLVDVEPGAVTIELPFAAEVTQQHGFVHAGALTTVVDTACGYAALTLMPPGSEVLTVEYKLNFLAPARGLKVVAQGRVLKPGRKVTVCCGDVLLVNEGGQQKLCAAMLATMIRRQITT